MLSKLFQPMRKAASAIKQSEPAWKPPATATTDATAAYSHIAVIAGRHCLAYQGTSCTTCVEHCPIDGALLLEKGLPRVVPAICTGCRLCQEACPAPQEAIRIVPRPPGMPPPSPAETTGQPLKSAFPALPPRTPSDHG